MKSTFWMTAQEAEDEIKSRQIVCGVDGCLFHDPTGNNRAKAFKESNTPTEANPRLTGTP